MKKYLVCPGWVESKSDRQRHFIDGMALIRLYGVDPQDCLVESPIRDMAFRGPMIRLEPRYDGDYTIPAALIGKEGV